MIKQYANIKFIDEPETLSTYSYISNGLCFEYFVGYELTAMLDYKNTAQSVKNLVSKCNQLPFREYPGIKLPNLNPKAILITRDGVEEILLSTRKLITPSMKYILTKFSFNLTNNKKLSPEQQNLSFITNAFKIEEAIPQYPVGKYRLDLYFPKYKIIIECDENGHADRHPDKEHDREIFVNKELGITMDNWVRFNPDAKMFNIASVIGQIYLRIIKHQEPKIVYIKAVPEPLTQEERKSIIDSKHLSRAKKNIDLLPEKVCTYCDVVKLLKYFNNAKDHRDGKENICKVCKRLKDQKRVKKYRENNVLPVEKPCNICNVTKLLDDFYRDKNSLDGHMRRCKDCHKERSKAPVTRIYVTEKCCKMCSQTKSVLYFGKKSNACDGYKTYCKICLNKKAKIKYYKK